MQKRLFLSGPIGCGKSTALRRALGARFSSGGGFLTVRQFSQEGTLLGFTLQRPSGEDAQWIFDDSGPVRITHMSVFANLGVRLLNEALNAQFIILDEIGGVEILSPAFMHALNQVFESGIPCIGVMKAPRPATRMIQKMGKEREFFDRAKILRTWMEDDPDTLLYTCKMYDSEAQTLARQWAAEYT